MASTAASIPLADTTIAAAIARRKQLVNVAQCVGMLGVCHSAEEWTSRVELIVAMLEEDAARPLPSHLLSQQGLSDDIILTSLLRYLFGNHNQLKHISSSTMNKLCSLIACPPSAELRDDPQELGALATLAYAAAYDPSHLPLIDALLQRGARLDGCTFKRIELNAMHNYASKSSSRGMLVLLERGAVLSTQHIATLCNLNSAAPLREIVDAGWMDLMRIEPNDFIKYPRKADPTEFMIGRHRQVRLKPDEEEAEQLLLLRGVHSNYSFARQAVLHTLLQTALLADIVNIVLGYFDGSDELAAVGADAVSAAAASAVVQ